MEFNNQLYIGMDNNEFYLTLYPATNISEDVMGNPKSEEVVVFYKVSDKSKVLVMSALEFVTKFKYHNPYPNLTDEYLETNK